MFKRLNQAVLMLAMTGGLICGPTVQVEAQGRTFEELKQASDDINALIDAEDRKSALCAGYVDKVVPITAFGTLAKRLPAQIEKGEFETTEQFNARREAASRRSPTSLSILALPINLDHVRYNADLKAMSIEASAFTTGFYSAETAAELGAGFSTREMTGGTPMPHSQTEKVLETYVARNRLGAAFEVSDVERQTNALHVTVAKLFPFAKYKTSPIAIFDVPLAAAPRVKQSIRAALVVQPQSPFVLNNLFNGPAATSSEPTHFEDRSTILVAAAKCGLILDSQSKVLASIDVGEQ